MRLKVGKVRGGSSFKTNIIQTIASNPTPVGVTLLIGVLIGGIIFVALIMTLIVCIYRRIKLKRRLRLEEHVNDHLDNVLTQTSVQLNNSEDEI
jgi:hypothetical protein